MSNRDLLNLIKILKHFLPPPPPLPSLIFMILYRTQVVFSFSEGVGEVRMYSVRVMTVVVQNY